MFQYYLQYRLFWSGGVPTVYQSFDKGSHLSNAVSQLKTNYTTVYVYPVKQCLSLLCALVHYPFEIQDGVATWIVYFSSSFQFLWELLHSILFCIYTCIATNVQSL